MTLREKLVLQPSPGHPITTERNTGRVVVTVGGKVVADTRSALTLHESSYPAVHYIPRQDVDSSLLERTAHTSYCPFKGTANYYSVPVGGNRSVNAIWTYEAPHDAVADIKDHIAFYPNRVDSITVTPVS